MSFSLFSVQVRQQLHDALKELNPDKDWSFITSQIGMFSYTGAHLPLLQHRVRDKLVAGTAAAPGRVLSALRV